MFQGTKPDSFASQRLPGIPTQNAGAFGGGQMFGPGWWLKIAVRLAPQRGGFGFIVAEELHDFSGTMAVFAIESPFWRIVAEK